MENKRLIKKIKNKISRIFKIDRILSRKEKKRLAGLPRFENTTVKFFGKDVFVVDPLTFLSSYYEIFKGEIYKFHVTRKDMTIIDCGANIGLSTIYFKMNFPEAKIVAFEPDPHIFSALNKNVSLFGYDDIICKNEAVSSRDAALNFLVEGGHSGMITEDINNRNTIQIKAIRLRSFLENYENITFLKIDIEGEEAKVIPDIADQLPKIDFLFLEYHSFIDNDQKLGELLNYITDAGMRYYIKEAANKAFPFINREIFLKMDLIVNIFCYR